MPAAAGKPALPQKRKASREVVFIHIDIAFGVVLKCFASHGWGNDGLKVDVLQGDPPERLKSTMSLVVGNLFSSSKRSSSFSLSTSSLRTRRSDGSVPQGFTFVLSIFLLAFALVPSARAQDLASISGAVVDPQGAVVTGAAVDVKNTDTGATRSTVTDDAGRFRVASIPVGNYEVHVRKDGFREEVQSGIHLVLGQDADLSVALRLGSVSEITTVMADAPPVSVESADVSGLVGERQVKDLPLNGRSYDLLIPLNPGVVNFTSEKTGGTGVSNSTNGNNFAVSGNRPQQNLFLLNGIEFTGAAENNMQPAGTSGMLLGVDAVREFNVLRDSYGAEYGKRPGAQVSIVTQSGTNGFHGSAYEFLRNNDLDSRNYFDVGSAPPFQRNQFGVSLGGPIVKDKTFFFMNYEGFRQNLHQTSVTFVPATDARNGTLVALGSSCPGNAPSASQAACAAVVRQLLTAWPTANGPELTLPNGNPSGIAQLTSSPLQKIREDFGTVRADQIFSSRDSLSGVYTWMTARTRRLRWLIPTAPISRICANRW
jgi:hypothetical protein